MFYVALECNNFSATTSFLLTFQDSPQTSMLGLAIEK